MLCHDQLIAAQDCSGLISNCAQSNRKTRNVNRFFALDIAVSCRYFARANLSRKRAPVRLKAKLLPAKRLKEMLKGFRFQLD